MSLPSKLWRIDALFTSVLRGAATCVGQRMGRIGGEMSLPSKLCRIDALFTSVLRGAATEC